jgi:hypothetical protein
MLNMNKAAFVLARPRKPPRQRAPFPATICVCAVYKIYPNPRMSAELHDMHALLQQLHDLNESHDLDHSEGIFDTMWAGAARAGNGLVAGVSGAATMVGGAHKAYKDAKFQKKRDEAVLKAWDEITDKTKRTQVLQKVIDEAGPDVLGPVLLGNAATKNMTQDYILPFPAA